MPAASISRVVFIIPQAIEKKTNGSLVKTMLLPDNEENVYVES